MRWHSKAAAAGAVALILVAAPAADAADHVYKRSKAYSGWISGGEHKSHRNEVYIRLALGDVKVQANNGVFTATGIGAVKQSYASGTYKVKCRWTSPAPSLRYEKLWIECKYVS